MRNGSADPRSSRPGPAIAASRVLRQVAEEPLVVSRESPELQATPGHLLPDARRSSRAEQPARGRPLPHPRSRGSRPTLRHVARRTRRGGSRSKAARPSRAVQEPAALLPGPGLQAIGVAAPRPTPARRPPGARRPSRAAAGAATCGSAHHRGLPWTATNPAPSPPRRGWLAGARDRARRRASRPLPAGARVR